VRPIGTHRRTDELLPPWEEAMGGAIFNGNINGRATAWMMVGMLIFAVAWESFTGYLERRFEDNKAHSEILSTYSGTFTGGHCALPRSVPSTRVCFLSEQVRSPRS
jgi:hypothetical protein